MRKYILEYRENDVHKGYYTGCYLMKDGGYEYNTGEKDPVIYSDVLEADRQRTLIMRDYKNRGIYAGTTVFIVPVDITDE